MAHRLVTRARDEGALGVGPIYFGAVRDAVQGLIGEWEAQHPGAGVLVAVEQAKPPNGHVKRRAADGRVVQSRLDPVDLMGLAWVLGSIQAGSCPITQGPIMP